MSGACPACGVAVVPGYVRCPKCQRPLPAARSKVGVVAGGTVSHASGRLPILPIAGGAVLMLVVILYFALSSSSKKPAATSEPTDGSNEPIDDRGEAPVVNPVPAIPDPTGPRNPNRVDPNATAADLERALVRERLWSNVEVTGHEIEVRSSSCRDENMMPMVDAARSALRNAGLTRLRCLEDSGVVVFERDL